MKTIALASLLLALITGCQAGTNVRPYDVLDQGVRADDIVVNDATAAVGLGVLPAKDATTLYTADQTFVVLGLPLLRGAAVQSAAPVLDPAAVTLTKLDADTDVLVSDLDKLHVVITNGVAAQIRVGKAAAATQPRK